MLKKIKAFFSLLRSASIPEKHENMIDSYCSRPMPARDDKGRFLPRYPTSFDNSGGDD